MRRLDLTPDWLLRQILRALLLGIAVGLGISIVALLA